MKKAFWDGVVLSGLLAQVEQVRVRRKPRHALTDILVIAICGVLIRIVKINCVPTWA